MIHVIDVETTGLNQWSNEILTCAVVTLDNDLKEVSRNEFRRKPEYSTTWSEEAEAVHRIPWEQANTFPDSKSFRKNLKSHLQSFGSGSVFVCHALPFLSNVDLIDYQFIFSEFNRVGDHFWLYDIFPTGNILSTITRSKKGLPVENQKLDTWAHYLGFDLDHHDAMSDALACAEVYKYRRSMDGFDRKTNRKCDFGLFGDSA